MIFAFLIVIPVDSLSILSLLQGPFDSPLVSEGTAIQNDINVFIFQQEHKSTVGHAEVWLAEAEHEAGAVAVLER